MNKINLIDNGENRMSGIKIFEDNSVRTLWNEDEEKWYISIVDVVEILTQSIDSTAYWRKLKQRLKAEGNETVTNCHGLKMKAKGGEVAKVAREALEEKTGKKVVTSLNAKMILEESKKLN